MDALQFIEDLIERNIEIVSIKLTGLFQLNSQVHNTHTRYNNNLHLLSTGLTLVQKGVAYSGCKIYNHLPSQIKKNFK